MVEMCKRFTPTIDVHILWFQQLQHQYAAVIF